jgi:hypothetical protein
MVMEDREVHQLLNLLGGTIGRNNATTGLEMRQRSEN